MTCFWGPEETTPDRLQMTRNLAIIVLLKYIVFCKC